MLVLSRKEAEVINIYDLDNKPFISVCVTRIKGDRVRIGLDLPNGYLALRAEVDHNAGCPMSSADLTQRNRTG